MVKRKMVKKHFSYSGFIIVEGNNCTSSNCPPLPQNRLHTNRINDFLSIFTVKTSESDKLHLTVEKTIKTVVNVSAGKESVSNDGLQIELENPTQEL